MSSLDLTGASIQEHSGQGGHATLPPAPSIALPNQDAEYVSHIALDIGGSLVKLIYFSPDPSSPPSDSSTPSQQQQQEQQDASGVPDTLAAAAAAAAATGTAAQSAAVAGTTMHGTTDNPQTAVQARSSTDSAVEHVPRSFRRPGQGNGSGGGNGRGGRLHFVKFETSRVEDAIAFIEAKGLHRFRSKDGQKEMRVICTGGGAYRYADLFKQRLGVVLDCEDEMSCLVSGCNFLLKAINHEAFTFENGTTNFVPTDGESEQYPYLLVNIGSGVSMVKVDGDGKYERVSGSSLGGGTFWGLARLLTGQKDFDEVLRLSQGGDNAKVDMLVGDIYGGRDYSTIGLSASTIASSFGKVIGQDKELPDYNPADISVALARMISYNIGQLAYLNAMRYNIKRIYFGGFFIRGHPYIMETISYAIRFWSKGEMAAMFLRHEGFLGAVGAFLKVHSQMTGATQPQKPPTQVRARFVERFSMGAPFAGGEVVGPAIGDLQEKVSWVEKFVAAGTPALRAAQQERAAAQRASTGGSGADADSKAAAQEASTGGGNGDGNAAAAGEGGRGAGGREGGVRGGAAGADAGGPGAKSEEGARGEGGAAAAASGSSAVATQATPSPTTATATTTASAPGATGSTSPPSSAPAAPPLAPTTTGTAAAAPPAAPAPGPQGLPPFALEGTASEPNLSMQSAGARPSVDPGPAAARSHTLPHTSSHPPCLKLALHVGVLHYSPSLEPFPLLADPTGYEPNTLDISADEEEFAWWLNLLDEQTPTVEEKAISSEGGSEQTRRRAAAFGTSFRAHLAKLRSEPGAYGRLGLAELFEMREECLREFGFADVYRLDKERENSAALSVLPDLLQELDGLPPAERLLAIMEGCLASNIWDWGARACVALYHDGTILDTYRTARQQLGRRPWAVDHFDALATSLLGPGWKQAEADGKVAEGGETRGGEGGSGLSGPGAGGAASVGESEGAGQGAAPVDSGGAASTSGNTAGSSGSSAGPGSAAALPTNGGASAQQPSTAAAATVAQHGQRGHGHAAADAEAAGAPGAAEAGAASGAQQQQRRRYRRAMVFVDNAGADVVLGMLPLARELLRMGCEVVLVANSLPAINDVTAAELKGLLQEAGRQCGVIREAREAALQAEASCGGHIPPYPGADSWRSSRSSSSSELPGPSSCFSAGTLTGPWTMQGNRAGEQQSPESPSGSGVVVPKLFVVSNGSGSPCMDFRRVPDVLAEACAGTDLLIIEGMGRAIHTNLRACFKCDTLKIAMIKTERLAKTLFGGKLYDCVCMFEPGDQGRSEARGGSEA